MSTAKSLTDEQVASIRSWAERGDELPDIQRLLADELEIKVTYLETRFLLEDLGIELLPKAEPEPEADSEAEPAEDAAEEGGEAEGAAPDSEGGEPGEVTVTVDKVQRPGAIVSGTVTFSGGKKASWWLDQMGRLGMDAEDPDYRPSEDELLAFQQELQKAIQSSGL